jgi:hypothetical protein
MKRKTTVIYEQERLLLQCQEAIADAIERSKLQRKDIASDLGKHKSFVTQALSSGRNLTISSLASLLWAAGFRLEPTLASIAATDGAETGGTQMHNLHLVARGDSYEPASGTQNGGSVEHGQSGFDAAG